MGVSIVAEGCEIRGLDQLPHVASSFVEAGTFESVKAEIEFSEVGGNLEVYLQDEKFNTLGLANVSPGNPSSMVEFQIWPTRPEMSVRVVFVPARGHALVRRVRITGFTTTEDQTGQAENPAPSNLGA
jgi:hypothetical protein